MVQIIAHIFLKHYCPPSFPSPSFTYLHVIKMHSQTFKLQTLQHTLSLLHFHSQFSLNNLTNLSKNFHALPVYPIFSFLVIFQLHSQLNFCKTL
jgi:hypothetical protein